jgi:hypothetical protein
VREAKEKAKLKRDKGGAARAKQVKKRVDTQRKEESETEERILVLLLAKG